MVAPASSPELARELDELRSRAYGPHADIVGDAHALARLAQLEALVRGDVLEPEPGAAASVASSPTPPLPRPASRPWWASARLWAALAAALAVGLVAGLVLPSLAAPGPVVTLHPAPIEGAPLDFQMYGIQSDSTVRYESYHDLQVWSARTESGSRCIVVTSATGEWVAAGCVAAPLNPTADVTFLAGMRPIEGLDLPDGSVLRFVLRGDVMDVWIAETTEGA